mmetsp:Transcript_21427/g.60691  ORF Transcript_21427/g.60691 Transcript_21427/m.60691 type:complete len:224 (+) Transcript_21427:65-736(+)
MDSAPLPPGHGRTGCMRSRRKDSQFPSLLLHIDAEQDHGSKTEEIQDHCLDYGPGVEVFSMGTPAGGKARQHFIGTPTGPHTGHGSKLGKADDDICLALDNLREKSDAWWPVVADGIRHPEDSAVHSRLSSTPTERLSEVDDATLLLDVQFEAAAISAMEPFAAPHATPARAPRSGRAPRPGSPRPPGRSEPHPHFSGRADWEPLGAALGFLDGFGEDLEIEL